MTPVVLSGLRRTAGALIVAFSLSACGGGSPSGPSPSAPQVLSINPSRGSALGGTSVEIGGANFVSGANVTIGGAPATDVVVVSATSITAKTPAHGPGASDVTVSIGGRSGVLQGGFTYDNSAAPAITAVTAKGTRTNEPSGFADLNEEIVVSAVVQDPDTPADQLRFEWTSGAGTFSGSGAEVRWRAPSAAATPGQVVLNVAVTDGVTRVTGSVTVSLHDSVKEVGDLAREFLLDFSDSSKSPDYVLRNFSTGPRCLSERDSEKGDIEGNRVDYQIQSSSIGDATVVFAFGGRPCSYESRNGDSCAAIPAAWTSLCLRTTSYCKQGSTTSVKGTDYVTAVYESPAWRLCASYFKSSNGLKTGFIR